MDPVLAVQGLSRRFGDVVANDEVDLEVGAGEIVGLLGHNGAGKTTLVSQVVGLLRPDAGTIRLAGVDAIAEPAAARRRVAVQAQAQAPIEGLTPRMAIGLAARMRGLDRRAAREATEVTAERLGITEWLDRRALPEGAGLSGGVRRLTSFAMAAIAPTPLVILDEPTNDVDPARRRRLWDLVRDLADGGAAVLLVTHNVVEAERVVDRLVVLDRGRVVASGTPTEVRGHDDTLLRLELSLPPGTDDDDAVLTPPVEVHRRTRTARRLLLAIPAAEAQAAIAWATSSRAAGRIEAFALTPTSLEDVYLSITDPASDEKELEPSRG
nr:ABC transporter ATP-binding protein [Nitriliruptor alkaliphilus]